MTLCKKISPSKFIYGGCSITKVGVIVMNVVILYSNCCEYKSISEVRDIIQENYSSYCGSECAASYSDLEQLLRDCLA